MAGSLKDGTRMLLGKQPG